MSLSPALTGVVGTLPLPGTAPTPATGETVKAADVQMAVQALLNQDATLADKKASLASPTFTGTVTVPVLVVATTLALSGVNVSGTVTRTGATERSGVFAKEVYRRATLSTGGGTATLNPSVADLFLVAPGSVPGGGAVVTVSTPSGGETQSVIWCSRRTTGAEVTDAVFEDASATTIATLTAGTNTVGIFGIIYDGTGWIVVAARGQVSVP
jgi:hypothetical protein